MPPGAINSYAAEIIDPETGEEEGERNDHFATFETKTIAGIETLVVRDTAYEDGILVEDTLDWYAQDDDGNVWYMGEIATNYSYDDEGEFTGTDFDGSWQAGVDGAAPGWIMRANPKPGDSYFQEFYPGVAVDEGEVIARGLSVETEFGSFDHVLKIRDTSSLEPGVGAFKYFAPGVGQVLEEEFAEDEPSLFVEIQNRRTVDNSAPVDPTDLAFAGDGEKKTITFLGEDAGSNDAIGAYTFDPVTGRIGEARMLFVDTEDVKAGARATMTVARRQVARPLPDPRHRGAGRRARRLRGWRPLLPQLHRGRRRRPLRRRRRHHLYARPGQHLRRHRAGRHRRRGQSAADPRLPLGRQPRRVQLPQPGGRPERTRLRRRDEGGRCRGLRGRPRQPSRRGR